jgi:hypothetical protein
MSVMPVFRGGGRACFFCTWKMRKKEKIGRNRVDNITGGGKLNSGKNKIHNIILRRNEIMKKKLIIAAAIAFAVFAIPCGSSALSTVSVASENNTVVTPSTKPVEEVKNAVDAIDTSRITDAASADNAAAALTKIGSQDLKEAMNAGQDTVNDVAAIEAAYKKAKGIKDTTLANSGAVKAVGIVGAAFVAPDTTLSVEAPAATPEIASSTYAVTSTPVYVEISLKAGPSSVKSLPIPVAVTIETPAGVDGNKAVIFHFVNGGLEEIKPIYNASANTLTFTVNHFSTFAIAEANNTATAEGTDNAFGRYRDNVASEIANAKDGATVKISRDKNINALPNDIMQALYKKQTVALELEYTFEGNEYTVTIPAGKAEDNAIEWYGPLYLQMRYGK